MVQQNGASRNCPIRIDVACTIARVQKLRTVGILGLRRDDFECSTKERLQVSQKLYSAYLLAYKIISVQKRRTCGV